MMLNIKDYPTDDGMSIEDVAQVVCMRSFLDKAEENPRKLLFDNLQHDGAPIGDWMVTIMDKSKLDVDVNEPDPRATIDEFASILCLKCHLAGAGGQITKVTINGLHHNTVLIGDWEVEIVQTKTVH